MELIVVKNLENLEHSLTLLRSEPSVLAYDTETNGLNPRKDKVISFSCASLSRAYNFVRFGYDPDTEGLKEYLTAEQFQQALNVLASKKIVTWNGAFDIPFTLNSCGIDLNPAWTNDAMLMLHTLDENRFSYGLKETATQEFGAAVKQEQSDLAASINANNGSKGEIWRGDVDLVAKYALQDAILTRKLFALFDMRLRHEKLDTFHNEEVFTLYKEVTVPMEQHGIQLNMLLLNDMAYKISGEINLLKHKMHKLVEADLSDFYSWQAGKKVKLEFTGNLRRKFCELYGVGFPRSESGSIITSASALKVKKNNVPDSHAKRVILGEERADPKLLLEAQKALIAEEAAISAEPYGFLFTSKDHLKRLLFTSWKLKALSKTPTGQPQVNEETISHYAADEKLTDQQKEFFNLLNYFNRLVKLNGTYYQRFLDEQEDGIFYPRFFQHKTVSGRYSSDAQQLVRPLEGDDHPYNLKLYVNTVRKLLIARENKVLVDDDFCLHPKTELLTKRGWVPVLEIVDSDEVWQVEPKTKVGSWCKPSRIINKDYSGKMYTFANNRGSLSVTENHTMLWNRTYKGEEKPLITKSQDNLPANRVIMPISSKTDGTFSNFLSYELNMAAMLAADSWLRKDRPSYYKIEVSRQKKIDMVRSLTGKEPNTINAPIGTQKLPTHAWYISYEHPLLSGKELNVDLIGSNQIDEFVKYLVFWDGSRRTKNRYEWGTVNKYQAESIQAKLVTNGYEARLTPKFFKDPKHQTYYSLAIRKSQGFEIRKNNCLSVEDYTGKVGCVTVETGFILVRSEGQTFVTGNCQLEPIVFAHVSKEDKIKEVFSAGEDFYSKIGIMTENLNEYSADKKAPNYLGKLNKSKRSEIKKYSLGIPYGLGGFKLHHELGIKLSDAEKLVRNYLKAFPALAEWMIDSEEQAVNNGYVTTQLGRKRRFKLAPAMYEEYGEALQDHLTLWKYCEEKGLDWEATKKKFSQYKNELNNAKNFQIQGLAASIANMACIAINREFKKRNLDAIIIAQIHDEIVVECAEEIKEEVMIIMQDKMENTTKLSVPLEAPASFGYNLAEAKG